MSLDVSPYISPQQRWAAIDDPTDVIVVDGPVVNRWLVHTSDGRAMTLTGAHIRTAYRPADA